jgi:HemY protein
VKLLFGLVLALLAAVGLGLALLNDPGYVLLGYDHWVVEASLSLLGLVLLLSYFVVYLLVRLIVRFWHLPESFHAWRERRRHRLARAGLTRGLVELAEGRWSTAEKRLLKHAPSSDTPLLNYLAAARAAQQQGEHERRDYYLRLAHESMSSAELAVGLTQAELQIAHRQLEQALATLTHLRSIAPRHAYVLKMLMRLYRELKDWRKLEELLPELRKRKVLSSDALERLEYRVHSALLAEAAAQGGAEALQAQWNRLPRSLRQNEELRREYAEHLLKEGMDVEAESFIRDILRKQWHNDLAYLYGLAKGADATEQLLHAEGWLKGHERNPILLLSLGRLAARARLWGKARDYLEASLGAGPRVETYNEMAQLLEQIGQPQEAMEYCRRGLHLAVGGTENGDLRAPLHAGTAMALERQPSAQGESRLPLTPLPDGS